MGKKGKGKHGKNKNKNQAGKAVPSAWLDEFVPGAKKHTKKPRGSLDAFRGANKMTAQRKKEAMQSSLRFAPVQFVAAEIGPPIGFELNTVAQPMDDQSSSSSESESEASEADFIVDVAGSPQDDPPLADSTGSDEELLGSMDEDELDELIANEIKRKEMETEEAKRQREVRHMQTSKILIDDTVHSDIDSISDFEADPYDRDGFVGDYYQGDSIEVESTNEDEVDGDVIDGDAVDQKVLNKVFAGDDFKNDAGNDSEDDPEGDSIERDILMGDISGMDDEALYSEGSCDSVAGVASLSDYEVERPEVILTESPPPRQSRQHFSAIALDYMDNTSDLDDDAIFALASGQVKNKSVQDFEDMDYFDKYDDYEDYFEELLGSGQDLRVPRKQIVSEKKKLKRQAREEMHTIKFGKVPFLWQRYPDEIHIREILDEIRDFAGRGGASLAFPPLDHNANWYVQELAAEHGMTPTLEGAHTSKYVVAHRTNRSTATGGRGVSKLLSRRQVFRRTDVKGDKSGKDKKQSAASVRIRNGHVVGQNASEISQENFGHRLMRQMGWVEGSGLGKEQGGIVAPIPARVKLTKTGLGGV